MTIYSNTEDIDDVKAKIYDNITISESGTAPTLIHTVITE